MNKEDCKYYRGIQAGECEAGVKLRTLVGGEDFGWCTRLPCLKSFRDRTNGETAQCAFFTPPTDQEIVDDEAEVAEMIAESERRFELLDPICEEIRVKHAGKDSRGTTTCPVCQGRLHWTYASYNAHIWLSCETDDCVRIAE